MLREVKAEEEEKEEAAAMVEAAVTAGVATGEDFLAIESTSAVVDDDEASPEVPPAAAARWSFRLQSTGKWLEREAFAQAEADIAAAVAAEKETAEGEVALSRQASGQGLSIHTTS